MAQAILGLDSNNLLRVIAVDTSGNMKLAASALAIGKLAVNSGVDIGDVTVNNAIDAGVYVRTGNNVPDATYIGDIKFGENLPGIDAGETHLGEVGVSKATVSVTPAITAGAYSALDIVGAIQTITNAARVSGGPVTLQSLTITDLGMQDANLRIFFFNQNPANGTYTDNIPLDIHDTDMGFCVGVFEVLSSDWLDAADNSVATLRNIGLGMVPVGTANLFAVAQTVGVETWASTSDLVFRYHFTDR